MKSTVTEHDATCSREQGSDLERVGAVHRNMLNMIGAGVAIIDPHTHVVEWVNDKVLALTGRPSSEIIGRVCYGVFCPAEVGKCPITDPGKEAESAEHVLLDRNGRAIPAFKSVKRVMIDGQDKLLETVVDISELALARQRWTESEEQFMRLLHASADAILIIRDNKFVECNDAAVQILRHARREEVLDTHPSKLSPPTQPDGRSSAEKADEMIALAFERGYHRFEWIHRRADGEDFPAEVCLTPINYQGGTALHCLWRDITEVQQAKREIQRKITFETAVADCSKILIDDGDMHSQLDAVLAVLQRATGVSRVYMFENEHDPATGLCITQRHEACRPGIEPQIENPGLRRLPYDELGLEPLATFKNNKPFSGVVARLDEPLREVLETQAVKAVLLLPVSCGAEFWGFIGFDNCESERPWLDDEVRLIEVVVEAIGLALQRKRSREIISAMDAERSQSQKMESIGQLAAGVAHEINNPVGFVMSNLGALQGYAAHLEILLDIGRNLDPETPGLPPDLKTKVEGLDQGELTFIAEDLDGLLAESLDGCVRMRDIVQNLKTFARADDEGLIPADLQECVESTLKIVWNELKYRCEVVKQYGEVPKITCRIGEINQVIMNLLVNAAQAIGERGTITITTRRQEQNAVLEIADSGCGIAPEHLARVFEPFFTTKPVGKGTGLGLNICHKIIEQHGGTIAVKSTLGQGTTFTVCLPLVEAEQSGEDIIG